MCHARRPVGAARLGRVDPACGNAGAVRSEVFVPLRSAARLKFIHNPHAVGLKDDQKGRGGGGEGAPDAS